MRYQDSIRNSYAYRSEAVREHGSRNRDFAGEDRRRRAMRKRRRRRRFRNLVCCAALLLAVFAVAVVLFGRGREGASGGVSGKVVQALTGKSEIERYADRHGISMDEYPQELLDLYERNPETKKFVCEYPLKKDKTYEIDLKEAAHSATVPLFMQWDERWGYKMYSGNVIGLTGCGPTCLSMAAVYLTGDTSMNPAWMADFATEHGYATDGNGSAWTLFSDGAAQLGLDSTEIPLDEGRIMDNIAVGNPVVAVMGPGDFTTSGHFIIFTGSEDGKLKVNDPNSHENSEKLWDFDDISGQIRQLWVLRK